MLYRYLRMAAATAVIATTMPLSAMNQDVDGKVTDENGQPLPNVNVVVKSRSFIGGVGNETDGNPKPNVPSLHIVASNFFGGVSIKEGKLTINK